MRLGGALAGSAASGMTADELSARRLQDQRARHPQAAAWQERLEATARDLRSAANATVAFAQALFKPAGQAETARAAADAAFKEAAECIR
jgi:hypothetical protein